MVVICSDNRRLVSPIDNAFLATSNALGGQGCIDLNGHGFVGTIFHGVDDSQFEYTHDAIIINSML